MLPILPILPLGITPKTQYYFGNKIYKKTLNITCNQCYRQKIWYRIGLIYMCTLMRIMRIMRAYPHLCALMRICFLYSLFPISVNSGYIIGGMGFSNRRIKLWFPYAQQHIGLMFSNPSLVHYRIFL